MEQTEKPDKVPVKIKSVEQIRDEAAREVDYINNPIEHEFRLFGQMFNRLDSGQLTAEFLIDVLSAEEKHYRENYKKKIAKYGEKSRVTDIGFEVWNETRKALQGAKGEGDIADTIKYFRDRKRDLQERIEEEREPGFIEKPFPFFGALSLDMGIKAREGLLQKQVANLETAAVIFERKRELSKIRVAGS